ncbi:MAG: alpha/beta hydrolase [Solirubrobacteraceae bacterium]|jgi:pimeloyl-ACP methyl ester carboxylesterase
MATPLLPGITASDVATGRLRAHVLERAGAGHDAAPVVLVHGNVSSSLFWQPVMLALPASLRPVAIDLRGFGGSQRLPVDATRGLDDFADDVSAVIGALGLDQVHLVGWSMGGGVVMAQLLGAPATIRTVTLVAPVSPYGFGGTAGTDGRRLTTDGAGTGGGGVNPDFVARLESGDTSDEARTSPRSVFRSSYVAPGFVSEHEDLWVASMLSTATGPDNYPGDSVASDAWPGFAAGRRGVLNTMAPHHLDLTGIAGLGVKPPILWVRGADDVIVSDTSRFDVNRLGALGLIPGWPGADIAPPQPMIAQTRAVLERYAAGGGTYRELVLAGCGHAPHIERPDEFTAALVAHLGV